MIFSKSQLEDLLGAIQNVLDSEDDTGCSDDGEGIALTVVDKSYIEILRDQFKKSKESICKS